MFSFPFASMNLFYPNYFLQVIVSFFRLFAKFAVVFFFFNFDIFLVNVGEDCPVFDGLYEFCTISSGGSIGKLSSFFNCISYLVL